MLKGIISRFNRLKDRITHNIAYCVDGVWNDTRNTFKVNLIKTLNLSVKSFFNGDIQSRACAMTYRTMLAIVPALALLFAIGKGFGLQDLLREEVVGSLPSQATAFNSIFNYVESYLDQSSSQGIFLGIGIVLLLWTLISLLSAAENSFNSIWGVKEGRSIWRKTTDYLAIFLILPVLMICASGITVFVTTVADKLFSASWVTSTISLLLDAASLLMIWMFFTGVYMLIPNTKVRFKNAFIAGILAGTAFLVLQWLFITGQVYVSKYNAIYGSVAFIPLLLIWMQLVWVITLAGAIVCYASQNIFQFNFSKEISSISLDYRIKIIVSVATVIVKRFESEESPLSDEEIARDYALPSSLVTKAVNLLIDAKVVMKVVLDPKSERYGLVPAIDPARLTVAEVISRIRHTGSSDFIPGFQRRFHTVVSAIEQSEDASTTSCNNLLLRDLTVTGFSQENDTPTKVRT